MFKFHIIGFIGEGTHYWSDRPVDIKVFAENQEEAITRARKVIGSPISLTGRKIYIEEILESVVSPSTAWYVRFVDNEELSICEYNDDDITIIGNIHDNPEIIMRTDNNKEEWSRFFAEKWNDTVKECKNEV